VYHTAIIPRRLLSMWCIFFMYGGCDARKCKHIVSRLYRVIECVHFILNSHKPSIHTLYRGFYAVTASSTSTGLPERICCIFGEGDDTCIMLTNNPQIPWIRLPPTGWFPSRHTCRVRVYHACVNSSVAWVDALPKMQRSGDTCFYNICGGYMDRFIDREDRVHPFSKAFSINRPNDEVLYYIIGHRWRYTLMDLIYTHYAKAAIMIKISFTIKTRWVVKRLSAKRSGFPEIITFTVHHRNPVHQ